MRRSILAAPLAFSIVVLVLVVHAASGADRAPAEGPSRAPVLAASGLPRDAGAPVAGAVPRKIAIVDGPVIVVPERVRQGDAIPVFVATAATLAECRARLLDATGKEIAAVSAWSWPVEGCEAGLAALLGTWSTQKPQACAVEVSWTEDGVRLSRRREVEVEARTFASFDLKATAAMTKLRTEPDPRKELESKILYELWQSEDLSATFLDSTLVVPVEKPRVTTEFGERIRYLYTDGTITSNAHAGIDFGAPIGTPVMAAARGRVVMARMRIMTGNSVIIEHLPGVYTVYYHLDSLAVKEGDFVSRGEPIGTVGTTGFSTGAHLHWDLRVRGVSVDPMQFVAAHPLDKKELSGRISRALSEGR